MSQRRRTASQPPRPDRTKQGRLPSFFPETRGREARTSKMAAAAPASPHLEASPTWSADQGLSPQRSVSTPLPSTSPPSPQESQGGGSEAAGFLCDGDLRKHIWALPTKADLDRFITRVETAFKEDIAQLKTDTSHLGSRLESVEQRLDAALPVISQLQARCVDQDRRIETLLSQLDDFENRSRRGNIRIRGLPEATAPKDIVPTLVDVFRAILELPATAPIEIDRAHRALRPPSQDMNNPRDVICKLHRFTLKDNIMRKMRAKPFFEFDGARLYFYQDLSRRTLMQRRALRPLLESLHAADITYRWGFPFYLQASKDGVSATLRTKDDLPEFLSALDLDPVDFPDWRNVADLPAIPLPQPWQSASRKRRKRNRQRPTDAQPPAAPDEDP